MLLVAGLVISLVMYGRMALLAGRSQALEKENQVLRVQSERIVDLKAEIDRLRSFEAKMLTVMGIDTLGLGRLRYEEVWAEGRRADSLRAARPGGGFVWPLRGTISRGYRSDGGEGTPHLGLDIAGETGAPVKASLRGLVVFAGIDSIFGNMLVLEHEGGLSTVYGHNSQLLVSQGDIVRAGQTIARLGSTGRSSAPHLHFEVREGGDAVDPLKYLQAE
jgi:murein DD-endopeptidase MepM/ murein hydrolase activator NlpD